MTRYFTTLLSLLITASIASAHGMLVIPTVGPGGVCVEVKYDDDTPAAGATVRILNAAGEELSKGTTDAKGFVDLPRPENLKGCKARAEDGMGHASSKSLPIPESEAEVATVKEEPHRLLSTIAGLAIIALIMGLLWYFWPRTPPATPSV